MKAKTPVRKTLKQESSLQPHVCDGLDAVSGDDRQYIDGSIRARFADSLEIDDNLRTGNETLNRWDYLLGDSTQGIVVGLNGRPRFGDAAKPRD